jgi:Domain of unknown function (DUF5122) beta-propeller
MTAPIAARVLLALVALAPFGVKGVVTSDVAFNAVALQPDGRIVAAGYARHGGFAVARFEADGAPDPTFGPAAWSPCRGSGQRSPTRSSCSPTAGSSR